MIQIFDVTKVYGGRQSALVNVSLQVGQGEFVFISGPSGAGKTTLLKLILCEESFTQGQILVDRINLRRLPARRIPDYRLKTGFVFQDFKLIPTRTVFQNVALRLEIEGARPSLIAKKVRYILKRVGLEGSEQAYPPQLSGGEQQRVAIARAVVGDPLIVLADEPTGNLDIDLTRDIIGLLEEINRTGTTIMVATHNQAILQSTSHRIIRLEKGRLVA
ncbi:MAG: ATP-binding cassette domain-containing protein [Proteobacteria bacterium]|nr:ATP-binding cassette domain-containing protein [Pseudomonadota bacterium]